MVHKSSWWYPIHYHILPPVLMVFFIVIAQYLAIIGQGQKYSWDVAFSNYLGDATSWKWTSLYCLWAILWMKVPSKTVQGPESPFGTRPIYNANGVMYYWATLVTFFLLQAFYPNLSKTIYFQFPKIIGVFNAYALILCIWLLIKGRLKPEYPEDSEEPRSLIFDFYRGVELHPQIFGLQVKQLTNCRIGMMGWEIFLCAFYLVGVEQHGFITSSLIHLLIQSVYIAKFFWWEVGYFHTLDMMMDRAGFYLCWGSLVVIPSLFTFSAAYTVLQPPTISAWISVLIGIFGLFCVLLTYRVLFFSPDDDSSPQSCRNADQYVYFNNAVLQPDKKCVSFRVDYEKLTFRESPDYKCTLWGKPATYILAEYKDSLGNTKKSALLTQGFWGLGRHLNYTFELGTAMAFCACLGFSFGVWNYLYFFFIVIMVFHRLYRDDEKCRNKYGKFWERYCKEVPYILVPGVW